MFKPCPKCGFLVALIAGREASQRCPRCGSVLMTESDLLELEDAPAPPAPAGQAPAVVDVAPVVASHDATAAAEATVDAVTAEPPPAVVSAQEPESRPAHDGPSFVRRRAPSRRLRAPARWWAAIAVLALLLGLQLLLAQRNALARDAAWRPLVLRACGLLRCEVPTWHEPQAFAMLARGVRPDPSRPGVLHVSATVRNDARWPQAAPVVVLSLSDVDGRVVGARAVPPADYGRGKAATVAPGDSVDIAFDVREPAARVESFDFQLQ